MMKTHAKQLITTLLAIYFTSISLHSNGSDDCYTVSTENCHTAIPNEEKITCDQISCTITPENPTWHCPWGKFGIRSIDGEFNYAFSPVLPGESGVVTITPAPGVVCSERQECNPLSICSGNRKCSGWGSWTPATTYAHFSTNGTCEYEEPITP